MTLWPSSTLATNSSLYKPDTEPGAEKWLSMNAQYAKLWPNITLKKEPPADAKEWERVPDKAQYFSQILGTALNPKSIRPSV